MKLSGIASLLYALALVGGGLWGYLKAGSVISLIMGSTSGLFVGMFIWPLFQGKSYAMKWTLGITFLLDGLFTYRLMKTHHFFPSGCLSLLSVVLLGIIAMEWRHHSLKATGKNRD